MTSQNNDSANVHLPFLVLHVRKEYFNQIKSGEKTEEYRQIKPYWTRRLSGPPGGSVLYDFVKIMQGYPSKDDIGKCLYFRYNGYRLKIICHKEFGKDPVQVYAITLDPKLRRDNPALSA